MADPDMANKEGKVQHGKIKSDQSGLLNPTWISLCSDVLSALTFERETGYYTTYLAAYKYTQVPSYLPGK